MASLKELLHTFVNHLNWREEQEIVDARSDIEELFPTPAVTEAGVKGVDGETPDFLRQ